MKVVCEKDGETWEAVLGERDLISVPPGVYRTEINIGEEDALMCVMLGSPKPITPTYPPDSPLAAAQALSAPRTKRPRRKSCPQSRPLPLELHTPRSKRALRAFALARQVELATQRVLSYREADCEAQTMHCRSCCCTVSARARLRGYSSSKRLSASRRVLAWDAPGYGESTPVAAAVARSHRLRKRAVRNGWKKLRHRTLRAGRPFARRDHRRFVCRDASAARGRVCCCCRRPAATARLPREVRETKRDQRLAMLNELGPARPRRKAQRQYVVRACKRRSARMGALEHVARDSGTATRRPRICSPTRTSPADLARFEGRYTGRAAYRGRRATTPLRHPRPASDSRSPRTPNCKSCHARGTPAISKQAPRTPRSSTRSAAQAPDNGANE